MEDDARYFEGCGHEGPIRCIFLCEFHPVAGPKITCQVKYDYSFILSFVFFFFLKIELCCPKTVINQGSYTPSSMDG